MDNGRKEKYHIHISAKQKMFELNLKEVWQYRDLIVLFTKRNFLLTYKQTILGPAWIFLNPFISSIIYTIVFGGIAGMSTDGVPKILFYLCSNAIWLYFSTIITKNANTFTQNANVFGKVYFPRLTIPVSNVLSAMIQFVVQMSMVSVFLIYYVMMGEVTANWWAFLLIPGVLVHLGVMGLGFGIMISSFTTKYRDLAILVTFGVQLWMYATPVVYPITQIEDGFLKTMIMLNPVTASVEVFRFAVLGHGTIKIRFMVLSWLITSIVAFLGIMIFHRVEKNFMDTV